MKINGKRGRGRLSDKYNPGKPKNLYQEKNKEHCISHKAVHIKKKKTSKIIHKH